MEWKRGALPQKYIVEVDDEERETQAIRHIVGLGSLHREELLAPFGFDALTFIIVEAQKFKLTPGIVGDVDILAGNLDFKNWADYRVALAEMETKRPEYPHVLKTELAGKMVSEVYGRKWPPEPVFVAGIEVKCAYFTYRLKASKSSKEKVNGIRSQVDWLEKMGLDKFGVLDVIGNEPAYREDGGYFGALHRAGRSFDAMSRILAGPLPANTRAAQFVWSAGSVGGGDEGMRGVGAPRMWRPPSKNALLESSDPAAVAHRGALLRNIPNLMAHLPAPRYFPVVFIDCRKCKSVHYLDDPSCA
jgi:hypothetical protein